MGITGTLACVLTHRSVLSRRNNAGRRTASKVNSKAQCRLTLTTLPDCLLEEVLEQLSAKELCLVGCCSKALQRLSSTDFLWFDLFKTRFGDRLLSILERSNAEWWIDCSWKERYASLVSGKEFSTQVYNRELDNDAEDFVLSAYDSMVSLEVDCLRLNGEPGDGTPTFTARYLPMGRMAAVMETGLTVDRLRLPPPGSHHGMVYCGNLDGLQVGEEVEVQWKGRKSHPFGWWFGCVQAICPDSITLAFKQYPPASVWRTVRAPLHPGKETLVNGDCSFGFVGGVRRLSEEEKEEWRRHDISSTSYWSDGDTA